ncbi:MAG: SUF system Fe-S cluster assembly protein [Bacteroidetes bacterium]|nr:SUF system Fe-S cluster assembly protein [Bacteroidota bacterium]MBU1579252.1 SUF system Fe-S cluster assembly protein [Bacteroidota bacterium]MBU2465034.1 SUF system Fe-S cluster assembly protein [Bacteroidota bacterium]MBU2558412.1 SUF system Fe-S cluster assembly protein [Bacteroidota bacterium]
MTNEDKARIEKDVITTLRTIYDPEIPVNIYELGLIYEISISENADVQVLMTLTTPNCPVAESLPLEVKQKVAEVKGVNSSEVELTFEPPWDQEMLSDEAKLDLGFL